MHALPLFVSLGLLSAPPPVSPWATLAERDLEAMHRAIQENHPGPVDAMNPGFSKWLEEGYRQALAKAREARTFGGYSYALRYYTAGFRDGHLNLNVLLNPSTIQWPGFIVGQRADRYLVTALDPAETDGKAMPPVGAELRDCDGLGPMQWLERDVWPYLTGPLIESRKTGSAGLLLQDRGNPAVGRAKTCRFQVGGETRTLELRYRPITLEGLAKVQGDAPYTYGARTFGKEGTWVSIPSFGANTQAGLESLRGLVAQAPSWRSAPVVVFDVRGNSGGNSNWGKQLLRGLYGEAFFDSVVAKAPGWDKAYVEWRVSEENLKHLETIVAQCTREFGPDSDTTKYFRWIQAGMTEAHGKGQALYREAEDAEPPPPAGSTPPASLFKGKVYLLTDSACASACLDFADVALLLPGVTPVGLPTSADSTYMEVRQVVLPSAAAHLYLPVKVYRNRPRGHNEPYAPKVRFEGDIRDTRALEAWITGLAAK